MKETRMEAFLYCTNCKDEQSHVVCYLNKRISEIQCQVCRRQLSLAIDLSHELYNEVLMRIRSKPSRISDEYCNDMSQLFLTLPGRVISKPFRIYREVKDIRGYFKKYRANRC